MRNNLVIAAYRLSCIHNHSYFFEDAPDDIFCVKCGCCIDHSYIPKDFKIKNKADFSATYDGRYIASSRFKEYIEKLDFNVAFDSLNKDFSLFLMRPLNIIKYSAIQQENFCPVCRQYFDQVLPNPIFFQETGEVLMKGIFSTSIGFGSGQGKNPSIILGIETAEMIKKDIKTFKFRGLDITEESVLRTSV